MFVPVQSCLIFVSQACDLYYKHIMIVNYDSSIVNKFGASLTDDTRVIIYDCHTFIVQATGVHWGKLIDRQSF
jgi:hypothetical protein